MEIKKDILWRVYLCYLAIALLGVAIVGRAIYIQRVQGRFWKAQGDRLHLRYDTISAERGSIYSEDGNMLSTSVPIFDIYIDFSAEGLREKDGKLFKKYVDSLSISLANFFQDKTAETYKAELKRAYAGKSRYYPLKKKISFEQSKAVHSFPLVRLGRNKSGFIFEPREKRINPYVLLANRTIGLSRSDTSRNVGLEKTYDSLLRGTQGQRLVKYVAGAYMPVEGAEVDPENGKDIITTLDTYMQDVAENALMKMMVDNNSKHGTVIIMETQTGKIKAIANLGKQADGVYTEDLNYGIGKRAEPGSVFKLVTLLSLLEDKHVDINSIVNCEGGQKFFYGLRIKDSHLGAGSITVKDAFARSSNVAFAKLADQYYHSRPNEFMKYIHRFRLDTITGIDITASSGVPVFYKPGSKYWHATSIPFMAHGYGELVTPLHLLMLYNAVANGGKMMKPYLVNEIREYGVVVRKFEPQVLVNKICSDATLEQARECMRAVVDSAEGTGHKYLFDKNYSIAGKSGTAVSAQDNSGYNQGNKQYQSSFIGYFPADAPRYSMAVVILNNKESKNYYGAQVAGTVFKEVSDQVFSHYISNVSAQLVSSKDSLGVKFRGLKTDLSVIMSQLKVHVIDSTSRDKWAGMILKNNNAVLKPATDINQSTKVTPDVTGLGLKDALYVLENKGFRTAIAGRGRVVSQSIPAGTAYNKGQKITIYLN